MQAFTRDISRAKVLTAGSIMQPYENNTSSPYTCTPTTKVEVLIPLVLASDYPIVVLDDQQQVDERESPGRAIRMALQQRT